MLYHGLESRTGGRFEMAELVVGTEYWHVDQEGYLRRGILERVDRQVAIWAVRRFRKRGRKVWHGLKRPYTVCRLRVTGGKWRGYESVCSPGQVLCPVESASREEALEAAKARGLKVRSPGDVRRLRGRGV